MRIDGTSTVSGAATSGEKRQKDGRSKFSLSSNSVNTLSSPALGAISPPLDTDDIGAMIALQEFTFEGSDDVDNDTLRETEQLIDLLQHMQESILNARRPDTESLHRQCELLRIPLTHASADVQTAAAAVLARADIELAKRKFSIASA